MPGDADAALRSAKANLAARAENLGRSLDNLANLTSNLNNQVQANTNILGEISRAIVDADSFVQGLKHHWLLRSAFRTRQTNTRRGAAVGATSLAQRRERPVAGQRSGSLAGGVVVSFRVRPLRPPFGWSHNLSHR